MIAAQGMDKLIMAGNPPVTLGRVQAPRPSRQFMAYAQPGDTSLDFLSTQNIAQLAKAHKQGLLALFHHQGHTIFESIYLTPHNVQQGKYVVDPMRQLHYLCSFFS